MNTPLFYLDPVPRSAAEAVLVRRLGRAVRRLGDWLSMPAPVAPGAVIQLLELARSYEATRPSDAAELRQIALNNPTH